MPNLHLCDLDLNKNALLNAVIQPLPSAPGSPVEGQIYYDTGDDTIYFRNASAWIDISGDLTGITAGTGLTGSGTSGAITLNVVGGTGIDANANDIAIDSTVATLSGSQTLTNKTIAASQVTEISSLTAGEGAQLENINSVTISNAQWGYLGAATGAITNTNTQLSQAQVEDFAGGLFSGNTETGITATYQASDNTVDLVVGTLNQDTTGNADTATVATTVTITDNESTNENNPIIFASGAAQAGGDIGLESDGHLYYNPSNGRLIAPAFVGPLVGNVTGNVAGNASTATALATGAAIAMTGDVVYNSGTFTGATSVTSTSAIQADAVHHGMLNDDIISGQVNALTALSQTDIFLVHDTSASEVKKITYSNLEDDIFANVNGDGTMAAGGTLTITQSSGDFSVGTNLTVAGNLTVNGTQTIINTATVEVEDNILQLNTTQAATDTATAATSGISIYRGDGVTQASLIFDDSDDTWDLTNHLTVAGTITGDVTGDLTGDVTGTVSGNAGTVTNGVYTTGNQTIAGTKQFNDLKIGTNNTITWANGDKIRYDDSTNSPGSYHFEADAGTNNAHLYAASFTGAVTGAVTGNADTATNLVASTSSVVALGSINMGHASDTTIARSASGRVTIEGQQIATSKKFALAHATTDVTGNNAGTNDTVFTILHGMGSQLEYMVQVIAASGGATVFPCVTRTTTTVVITFNAAAAQSAYTALLVKI